MSASEVSLLYEFQTLCTIYYLVCRLFSNSITNLKLSKCSRHDHKSQAKEEDQNISRKPWRRSKNLLWPSSNCTHEKAGKMIFRIKPSCISFQMSKVKEDGSLPCHFPNGCFSLEPWEESIVAKIPWKLSHYFFSFKIRARWVHMLLCLDREPSWYQNMRHFSRFSPIVVQSSAVLTIVNGMRSYFSHKNFSPFHTKSVFGKRYRGGG